MTDRVQHETECDFEGYNEHVLRNAVADVIENSGREKAAVLLALMIVEIAQTKGRDHATKTH